MSGLFLAGCAARPPLVGAPSSLAEAVAGNYAQVETIVGTASFRVRDGAESVRLGGALLFRRPDRLRVEVLTPLGQAVATFVYGRNQVRVHDHQAGRWFEGESVDGMVELLGLAVPVEALLETLRDGGMPVEPSLLALARDLPPGEDGGRRLELRDAGRVIEMQLDPRDPVVRARSIVVDGGVIEVARYDDFQGARGVQHPNRITVEWPGADRGVEIRFRKKALNHSIDDERFVLDPPPGVGWEPLERDLRGGGSRAGGLAGGGSR